MKHKNINFVIKTYTVFCRKIGLVFISTSGLTATEIFRQTASSTLTTAAKTSLT